MYAPGNVQQKLTGNNYDRALHGLQFVDKVLNIKFLFHFKSWCEAINHQIPHEVDEVFSV